MITINTFSEDWIKFWLRRFVHERDMIWANTRRWYNVAVMLGHRIRRWPNSLTEQHATIAQFRSRCNQFRFFILLF